MKNYWCCICNSRWQGDEPKCPVCHEHGEVRDTMSEEETREKGLLDN